MSNEIMKHLEENVFRYEADDYAMPGLGYFESEPMCHCVKCQKKRQVLNKLTDESREASEIERDQTES